MKKVIVLLSITVLIVACKQESENNKGDVKQPIVSENNDDKNAILDLERSNHKEIVGLWKHYKTVYASGESDVERTNSFMEIKENNRFDFNNYEGAWFLSFCKDTVGVATLFTTVQSYRGYDEAKITVYRIQKTIENNTTYLKLTALTDGRQSYYIRQQ